MSCKQAEFEQRLMAMRRLRDGDRPTDICRELGKSREWLRYWRERFDPDDVCSLHDRLPGRDRPANKMPIEWEERVIAERKARAAHETPETKYAFIGADAIHVGFVALEYQDVPSASAIHRLLKAQELIPCK